MAIQNISIAALSDVLSCFGIPTATANAIYAELLENRRKEALEILMTEIRQGDFRGVDNVEAVSIVARYCRDAIEGAAKNNLRLMAKVINGMSDKKELTASNFLKYANILAGLTEDEIFALGIMAKYHPLSPEKNMRERDDELRKVLGDKVAIIQQALIRTGLVSLEIDSVAKQIPKSNTGPMGFGPPPPTHRVKVTSNNHYRLTSLMDEILQYTDFVNLYQGESI